MTTKTSRTQGARDAVVANPVTATAAVGICIGALGALLGWAAETQAALAQLALGVGVLLRLAVLAYEDAKRKS